MPAAFATATAVTLAGDPGLDAGADAGPLRWRADIPSGWNVPTGVHGGVLLATALRSAEATLEATGGDLDPVLGLRTAHASFLARPERGELDLTAQVRRRGGTTAHIDVTARDVGATADVLDVRALFARPRPTDDGWTDVDPPDVPGPEDCPPPHEEGGFGAASPLEPPPLFDHLDLRPALGTLPWEDGWAPGAAARYARWNRFHEAPARADATVDPLGLLPMLDLPGPAVWLRFGPDDDMRYLVSLELTVDLLAPVPDDWVLTDFHARWLGDGYLTCDADAWSGGRLVGTARQTMLVRRVPQDAAG